jgi:hypothetical protein
MLHRSPKIAEHIPICAICSKTKKDIRYFIKHGLYKGKKMCNACYRKKVYCPRKFVLKNFKKIKTTLEEMHTEKYQ